jgi:hypothetical protein
MVPLRLVLAAPISIRVHTVNISADLGAMLPMLRGIAVDPGSIGLKFSLAIFPGVTERDVDSGQRERENQRRAQSDSNKLFFHSSLPNRSYPQIACMVIIGKLGVRSHSGNYLIR